MNVWLSKTKKHTKMKRFEIAEMNYIRDDDDDIANGDRFNDYALEYLSDLNEVKILHMNHTLVYNPITKKIIDSLFVLYEHNEDPVLHN